MCSLWKFEESNHIDAKRKFAESLVDHGSRLVDNCFWLIVTSFVGGILFSDKSFGYLLWGCIAAASLGLWFKTKGLRLIESLPSRQ